MKHQLLNLTKKSKQSGFTIIKVALVLAIAGLIFLVVFLSITSLQNSQKDMERRQVIGSLVSGLTNYESDMGATNGGALWRYEAYILNYANLPTGYTITFSSNRGQTLPSALPTTKNIDAAAYSRCGSDTSSSATIATLFTKTSISNEAAGSVSKVGVSGAFAREPACY